MEYCSLTEGYGEGPKFEEVMAPFKRLVNPGTGEIPPNALQVAPFAGAGDLGVEFTNDVWLWVIS